jgi:hypothetical protein
MVKKGGRVVAFQTKLGQAAAMILSSVRGCWRNFKLLAYTPRSLLSGCDLLTLRKREACLSRAGKDWVLVLFVGCNLQTADIGR